MNTNINLLLPQDEKSLKERRRMKLVNLAAILSLLGVGFLSFIIFLMIDSVDINSVKRDQENILREINLLEEKQAKLIVVNDRIENVKKVLSDRRDLSFVMSSVLTRVPSNLEIADLSISDTSIVVTVVSSSLFPIGEFINNITVMVKEKEVINSLVVSSLIFDKSDNNYHAVLRSEL
jgi:hypothetical protein